MKEFVYKLSVNVGDGEKSIDAVRRSIIDLEKKIVSLQEKSKEGVDFRIGKPNELKVAQGELAKLQKTLVDLGGSSASVTQVQNNVNQLGGAIVGLAGQYAGLNTAIAGSTEVMSEQEFVNAALAASSRETSKAIDEQTTSVQGLSAAASEPIKLDVNVDRAQIDALLQNADNAEKQLEILDGKEVSIDATSNLDAVKTEVTELSNEVSDKKELNVDSGTAVVSVGKLRKEVIALQTELDNTEVGSEKYKQLEQRLVETSTRLAETKDRFDDLSDSVKLNVGSSVERASNSFKLLRDGIVNLDFAEVNTALKGLGGAFTSAFKPSDEFKKSIGDLGKGIINLDFKQFKSGVDGVSTGFKGLGKAIAGTGIGLLVIGVTTLIANFDELKDSGGLVGKVFTSIGDIIQGITDKVFAFTDALGLTNVSADRESKKTIDNYNKQQTAIEKRYDAEIRVASAAGKQTVELEREKAKEIIRLLQLQKQAILDRQTAGLNLTEEDKKQVDELSASIDDYSTKLRELNAAEQKAADDRNKQRSDELKAQSDAYSKSLAQAKVNYDLQLALIKSFEEQRQITAEEANEQILQSELDYAQKRLDAYRNLALADNELSEGEKQRIIDLQAVVNEAQKQIDVYKQTAASAERLNKITDETRKKLQELNIDQIEIDIKARIGIEDADLVSQAQEIASKQILLDEQRAKFEEILRIQEQIQKLEASGNFSLKERDALLQQAAAFGADTTKTLEQNVDLMAQQIANEQTSIDLGKSNLDSKKELIKLQDELNNSIKLSLDQTNDLRVLDELITKGGSTGRAAEVRKEQLVLEFDQQAAVRARDAALKVADELEKQLANLNLKLSLEGLSEEEKSKLKKEYEDTATQANDAYAKAEENQKKINAQRAAEFDAEQRAQQRQQLVDFYTSLANEVSSLLFDLNSQSNQREFDQRIANINATKDAEIAAIEERAEKGVLTEEQKNAKILAANERAVKAEETLRKQAFEREKKLKAAQATIEFGLTLIRIRAAAAAASVLAGATAGPAGVAAAQAQGIKEAIAAGIVYAANLTRILTQKYKDGGVVKLADGGLAEGPSHAQGGIPFTIKGKAGYEMEGGEYIIKKKAVDHYGADLFEKLNKMKFASGGIVPAAASATISDNFTSIADFDRTVALAASSENSTIVPLLKKETPAGTVYVSEINRAQKRLNQQDVSTSYGNNRQ